MKPFIELPIKVGVNALCDDDKIFVNDVFQVNVKFANKVKGIDGFVWLSIKRIDKGWIHDWRLMQKIKNMICGNEREGCELYPAESRLVDTSNQFHIFVLPKGDLFPFGYIERKIIKGHKGGWHKGSSQRDFKINEQPEDAISLEESKDWVYTKIAFNDWGD